MFNFQQKMMKMINENVKLNFLWNRKKFFKNMTNIQFDIFTRKIFRFSMFNMRKGTFQWVKNVQDSSWKKSKTFSAD